MERRAIHVDEKVPFLQGLPLSLQHLFAMFGATVLVSGISGAAIKIGAVQLKGMALGTLVAITLSLLFALFDLLGRGEDPGTAP